MFTLAVRAPEIAYVELSGPPHRRIPEAAASSQKPRIEPKGEGFSD
jgi:hypothetical protein